MPVHCQTSVAIWTIRPKTTLRVLDSRPEGPFTGTDLHPVSPLGYGVGWVYPTENNDYVSIPPIQFIHVINEIPEVKSQWNMVNNYSFRSTWPITRFYINTYAIFYSCVINIFWDVLKIIRTFCGSTINRNGRSHHIWFQDNSRVVMQATKPSHIYCQMSPVVSCRGQHLLWLSCLIHFGIDIRI